jgi:hypothetical protein
MTNLKQQIFLTNNEFNEKLKNKELIEKIESKQKVFVQHKTNSVFKAEKAFLVKHVNSCHFFETVHSEKDFKNILDKEKNFQIKEGFLLTFLGLE